MKKARAWLASHGVDHQFHDYKESGIDRAKLEQPVLERGRTLLVGFSPEKYSALKK